jgi:mono/diheme cytochrome c family protein
MPNGDAALGKAVFEENCATCHALAVIILTYSG